MKRTLAPRSLGHLIPVPNLQTAGRAIEGRIGESQCRSLGKIGWLMLSLHEVEDDAIPRVPWPTLPDPSPPTL